MALVSGALVACSAHGQATTEVPKAHPAPPPAAAPGAQETCATRRAGETKAQKEEREACEDQKRDREADEASAVGHYRFGLATSFVAFNRPAAALMTLPLGVGIEAQTALLPRRIYLGFAAAAYGPGLNWPGFVEKHPIYPTVVAAGVIGPQLRIGRNETGSMAFMLGLMGAVTGERFLADAHDDDGLQVGGGIELSYTPPEL